MAKKKDRLTAVSPNSGQVHLSRSDFLTKANPFERFRIGQGPSSWNADQWKAFSEQTKDLGETISLHTFEKTASAWASSVGANKYTFLSEFRKLCFDTDSAVATVL